MKEKFDRSLPNLWFRYRIYHSIWREKKCPDWKRTVS